MKTVREIIALIDDIIEHSLDRPEMYASNPQSLEDQLKLLDSLRHFAIGSQVSGISGYAEYCIGQGLGASDFTHFGKPNPPIPIEERRKPFKELIEFWRVYLVWRDNTETDVS